MGDDGDLDAMADAIGGADLGAAGAGTGAADDDFDLFAIADDAAGDDTDDLFAMIDRPEQNVTEETDVAQSLASIAQYIQGAE